MEKPDSMTLREWLVKKVSRQLVVPEKVVHAIVTHQFDNAYGALNDNNSVELYDFGKFVFNKRKAEYQMKKYLSQKDMYEATILRPDVPEEKKRNFSIRLEEVYENISILSKKLL